jgi:2-methylcitrate dehydratase PrpD
MARPIECLQLRGSKAPSTMTSSPPTVAGHEIQIRFQDACTVAPRGWFSGMYLEFSVPLAVDKLLDLNVDQLTHAVAVTASRGNTLGNTLSSRTSQEPRQR